MLAGSSTNIVSTSPLRLALNATGMLSPQSGIGRYVNELARALTELDVHIDYFDAVNGWRDIPPPSLAHAPAGMLRFLHNLPGARSLQRKVQQLRFSRGSKASEAGLYHEPGYLAFRFKGPTVITVHDASWVRYPDAHPIQRVRSMNRHFSGSIERAQRIIVDSAFVARELNELFGVSSDRVSVVHLGVSPCFRAMSPLETLPVCEQLGLAHGCYVLAVGTLEPRKNLLSLLRAFRRLPHELSRQYPLVIAGMVGWLHEETDKEIAALEKEGLLRILGPVTEEVLPSLYAAARLFVYPSIYEGFGLPPLEAMACGAPVITSDRASLPEVVGDAGLCVDPYDIDAMAEAIRSILEDPQRQQIMGKAGNERSRLFTWQRCARETLAVYQKAIAT